MSIRKRFNGNLHHVCAILLAAIIPQMATLTGFYLVDDIKMIYRGIYPDQYPIFHDPLFISKSFFRPLVVVLCRIDGFLWGTTAWGYRLTNIALFCATALLTYYFIRRLIGARYAFFGAIVFVLHPIQVQAVAWICGRVDLLPGFLLTAAVLLLIDYPEGENRGKPGARGRVDVVAGGAFFMAALFSKEVAITFPVIVWLGEILIAEKSPRDAMRRAAVPAVMVLIYLIARTSTGFWPGKTFYSPLETNINGWLGNMIVLIANLVYIPFPFWSPMDIFRQIAAHKAHSAETLIIVIGYVTILSSVIIFFSWRLLRGAKFDKMMLFGFAWILIAVIPSVHVLRNYGGSRYLFPAMPGVAIVTAAFAKRLGNKFKPGTSRYLAAAFVVICLITNVIEQTRWRKAMDIAEKTTRTATECATRLPDGSNLVIFDMPHESPTGRHLYPDFDNYSLSMAYSIVTTRPDVKILRGLGKNSGLCRSPGFYCISWKQLIEGACLP